MALWAVLLAAWPATANAQETSPAKDQRVTNRNAGAAERVVIAPGACLWSISERQLGPNAAPQQIASEVERIYALNRDQICADPNPAARSLRALGEREQPVGWRAEAHRVYGDYEKESPYDEQEEEDGRDPGATGTSGVGDQ